MWKKFNNWSKDQQYISEPVLFDTSVEERYLETIPEVDSIKSARNSVAMMGLPDLPLYVRPLETENAADLPFSKSVEPMPPNARNGGHDRTSSVYSQPTPPLPQEPYHEQDEGANTPTQSSEDLAGKQHRRGSSEYSVVSPLSTPRNSGDHGRRGSSPDISPIDSQPYLPHRFPMEQPKPKSHLPVLRKPAPSVHALATHGVTSPTSENPKSPTPSGDKPTTKWDAYSGEPSATGKEATVKPRGQKIEMQFPDLKEKTRALLAGLRERDPQNRSIPRKAANSETLEAPVEREPWKGASGRVAIVKPVKNTPQSKLDPIKIPSNTGRKVISPVSQAVTTSPTVRAVPAEPEEPGELEELEESEVKPPAPLRTGKNSPHSRSASLAENNASALQSSFKSPHPSTNVHIQVTMPEANTDQPLVYGSGGPSPSTPIPSHTFPARSHSRPEFADPKSEELLPSRAYTHPQTNTLQPHIRSTERLTPNLTPGEEDQSRFSWTTYATTVNDSPPDTPLEEHPPVPSMPTSLVMRKRPVEARPQTSPISNELAARSNTTIVVRKPTPADRRRASTLLTSTSNTGKALPQCPPEMEAGDKISTLEARMVEFTRRKGNINKLVKQLNQVIIGADYKSRDELKRTVGGLQTELADVTAEEHEVGIKLQRCLRKRDAEEGRADATGLWIKRVTG